MCPLKLVTQMCHSRQVQGHEQVEAVATVEGREDDLRATQMYFCLFRLVAPRRSSMRCRKRRGRVSGPAGSRPNPRLRSTFLSKLVHGPCTGFSRLFAGNPHDSALTTPRTREVTCL
jgi:hypothetical protein